MLRGAANGWSQGTIKEEGGRSRSSPHRNQASHGTLSNDSARYSTNRFHNPSPGPAFLSRPAATCQDPYLCRAIAAIEMPRMNLFQDGKMEVQAGPHHSEVALNRSNRPILRGFVTTAPCPCPKVSRQARFKSPRNAPNVPGAL